ncbi:DUF3667 domain-containing protein [Parerythrobacter aestuarii]|uniref:DUF3667 domain-containing protein n=1 Tax=Parerythrobacter aestuarii TaxID=3020909 RepID=UPI0024DE780B|nr:DUF3667 domain-containing protein [Parerythrobacter aestuarii]
MSEIGEALGTASEGGLFARVVGRKWGGNRVPAEMDEASGNCLNCGAELTGNFCHECGQKAHIHRTISAILHDLIHGVLHLDGKLWRTLPLLMFKPGKLTRDYIEGKRARFVSPMAMFLFSIFLMFAVFQALGITTPTDLGNAASLQASLEKGQEELEKRTVEQRQRVAEMSPDSPQYASAVARLETLEQDLERLGQVEAFNESDNGGMTFKLTGIESIDDGLVKKWREHPELMLYKLQNNSYKFSWLLIPLSVPFVWLLFLWRRRFKAYDHAIFVTYSLAFMSLLFITLSILGMSGILGYWAFAGLAVIPPVHMYKHLRYTYDLSRFSALWRLFALSLFIWIVILLFLQLLLLLGAF